MSSTSTASQIPLSDPVARAGDQQPASGLLRVYPERFDMLDAWRGIAALVVVLHHSSSIAYGHEAVMLFFVISGYCILASADACRRRGLGFGSFMWRRVKRIYPPYLLAVLFFIATRVAKNLHGGGNQLARPWYVWLQNFTLTQWVSMIRHPQPFASENPANFVPAFWSLNYEEQFYLIVGIIMGAAFLWGSRRAIVGGLILLGLVWNFTHPSIAYGFFLEYWPHFGIGALLFYRLCRVRQVWPARAIDLALLTLAVGCAAYRFHTGYHVAARLVWSELMIVSAFALVLIATRRWNEAFRQSWIGRPLMALGAISYSLYLVHQFNLHLAGSLARHIIPLEHVAALRIALEMAIQISIATIFWYFCERPFLNRSLVSRTSAAPVTAIAIT